MVDTLDFLSEQQKMSQALATKENKLATSFEQFQTEQSSISKEILNNEQARAQNLHESTLQEMRLYQDVSQSVENIDKINNSFTMRLLEPFAFILGDEYSRKKQAENIVTNQQRIKIVDQQQAVTNQQADAKAGVLQQRLKNNLAKVQADETGVNLLRESIRGLKEQFMTEQQLITTELQKTDNPDSLKGRATGQQIREEKMRRSQLLLAQKSMQLDLQSKEMRISEETKKLAIQSMKFEDAQRLLQESKKTGGIVQGDSVGFKGITFNTSDLQAVVDAHASVFANDALHKAESQVVSVGISGGVNTIAQTLGANTSEMSTEEGLGFAINSNKLDSESKRTLAEAQQLMQLSQNEANTSREQTDMLKEAEKRVTAVNEMVKKSELAKHKGQPTEIAQAEFLNTGSIDNLPSASAMVASGAITGDGTGEPIFDTALQILSGEDGVLAQNDLLISADLTKSGEVVNKLATSNTKDLKEARTQIVNAVIGQGFQDFLREVATNLQDQDALIAMQADNSTISSKGQVQTQKFFDQIIKRSADGKQGPTTRDYSRVIVDLLPKFIDKHLSPHGPNPALIAAIDKTFFGNQLKDNFLIGAREFFATKMATAEQNAREIQKQIKTAEDFPYQSEGQQQRAKELKQLLQYNGF